MKKLLLFIVLLSSTQVFAQDKIAKIVQERWDNSKEKWVFNSEDSWDFNPAGQEIFFEHRDANLGDYSPIDYWSWQSYYNDHGNLIQKNTLRSGYESTEKISTYQYNDQHKLVESLEQNINAENQPNQDYKYVYTQDEEALSRSVITYTSFNGEDWSIMHQRDSLFNANGCLVEASLSNYDFMEGILSSNHVQVMTYDEDCRITSLEHWKKYNAEDTLSLFNRQFYTYSDDYRISTSTSERFYFGTNEWKLRYLIETEEDEAGRRIRYFHESYSTNYTDTILHLHTYTDKGEVATQKKFRTRHLLNDNPLYQTRMDSFIYHYDDEGLLVQREQFIQNHDNPLRRATIDYEYYCQGQLKQEVYWEQRNTLRVHYDYHSETGCPLESGEQIGFSIFPNPSNGSFTIESNLLRTPNVVLSVLTMLGQEVYVKKVNRLTDRYLLNFSTLPKGRYVVTLSNDEEIRSELIVIN